MYFDDLLARRGLNARNSIAAVAMATTPIHPGHNDITLHMSATIFMA